MNNYLPSKKFTFIVLSIIFALGVIYIVSFFGKTRTVSLKLTDIETKAKVQEFLALDSDIDGLKDWEETLWKTDPKMTDTDKDGTNDGEEVNLYRDPLKANTSPQGQTPNDKIDEKIILDEKKAEEDFSKLTATEKMSRELFSQYIATKKIDSPLSELEKQTIIESVLSDLPQITLRVYTEKDILILPLSDNESLRVYSNNVANIILTGIKNEVENIGPIITDLDNIKDDTKLTEETKEIFKRFSPLIEKNKKIVASLLEITVPEILLTEHLKLLNAFQDTYQSLDLMQKSAEDIITLVPILKHYESSVQNLSDSIMGLATKLTLLKITYTNKTDYGYSFFNAIISNK